MTDTDPTAIERTVVFIDLAGFTVATAAHGDETAADLAERLGELTTTSLGDGDQLVKGIGDAVMLVSNSSHEALALAGRICHLADHEAAFPLLRIGLHHGPVVERGGDWFGATVNVAARIAALAQPDQVVATAAVADAAEHAGLAVAALGPTALRGIPEPVDLYAITSCPALPDRSVDPICQMAVGRSSAAATRTVNGVEHLFCSPECVRTFDRLPTGEQ